MAAPDDSTDSPFAGRVALVTGASGGIGAELSRGLARDGAALALHYASNESAASELAAEIEAAGGRALTLAADLSDATAPERLVADVEGELGPVDVLAANAGLSRPATWEEVDAQSTYGLRSCLPVACCPACANAATAASSSRRRWPR